MLKRFAWVLFFLTTIARGVLAQTSASLAGSLTSATCPGTGCLTLSTSGFGATGIQLKGTFTATVQFETSADGVTFAALAMTPIAGGSSATSATAPGLWTGPTGGLGFVRVRVSSYTSGSVGVQLLGSLGARYTPPTGPGTVTSIATTAPITGGPITGAGTIACASCLTTAGGQTVTGTTTYGAASTQTFTAGATTTFNNVPVFNNKFVGGAGGSPTQVQFNSGGSFAGIAGSAFDGTSTTIPTFRFNGPANPVFLAGGDDGFGDTALTLSSPIDAYISIVGLDGELAISTLDAPVLNAAAHRLTLFSGAGNGSGAGGNVVLLAGDSPSGAGGGLTVQTGTSAGAGAGGSMIFVAGASAGGGGGTITMQPGSDTTATAGGFQVNGGTGANGGPIVLNAGPGSAGPGGVFATAGGASSLSLGGAWQAAGGDAVTAGGALLLRGGTASGGPGGAAAVSGGNGSTAGGNLTLQAGNAASGALPGTVLMQSRNISLEVHGNATPASAVISSPQLAGSGTAPLCLTAAGAFYRGTNTAGVLACP